MKWEPSAKNARPPIRILPLPPPLPTPTASKTPLTILDISRDAPAKEAAVASEVAAPATTEPNRPDASPPHPSLAHCTFCDETRIFVGRKEPEELSFQIVMISLRPMLR